MQAVLAPERTRFFQVPIGSTMLLFSTLHPAEYHTRMFYSRTGGTTMALYMAQFAYTPEAWTAFTKHLEDRDDLRPYIRHALVLARCLNITDARIG